jgi:hypothetical protein
MSIQTLMALIANGSIQGPFTKRTWLRTAREYLRDRSLPSRAYEFWCIYRIYKRHNSARYSARIAWGCAFRDLPF